MRKLLGLVLIALTSVAQADVWHEVGAINGFHQLVLNAAIARDGNAITAVVQQLFPNQTRKTFVIHIDCEKGLWHWEEGFNTSIGPWVGIKPNTIDAATASYICASL